MGWRTWHGNCQHVTVNSRDRGRLSLGDSFEGVQVTEYRPRGRWRKPARDAEGQPGDGSCEQARRAVQEEEWLAVSPSAEKQQRSQLKHLHGFSWQGGCERDWPKLSLEGDKLDPNCRVIAVKDTRST